MWRAAVEIQVGYAEKLRLTSVVVPAACFGLRGKAVEPSNERQSWGTCTQGTTYGPHGKLHKAGGGHHEREPTDPLGRSVASVGWRQHVRVVGPRSLERVHLARRLGRGHAVETVGGEADGG